MPLLKGKQTLLLPVNPLFVRSSIVIAFMLNLLLGKAAELLNILDIVLFFWCLRESRIIKSGTGFITGIMIDLYFNSIVGQNAFCYTITAAISNNISVRFLFLPHKAQALLLMGVLIIKNLVTSVMFILIIGRVPPIGLTLSPFISAVLYPIFSRILLAPQLRPTSSSETPI